VNWTEKMIRRILYVQFGDPAAYPPIEHSSGILADRGWEVLLLSTDAFTVDRIKLSEHPNFEIKKLSLANSGGRLNVHYIYFALWCIYLTLRWRPAWIYASDPFSTPAVWLVRCLKAVRLVYHEHDSPNVDAAGSWFARAVSACRKRIAKTAELCIIPQQERLKVFVNSTGRQKPTLCVWNCPRLEEIPAFNDRQNQEQSDRLALYYHGSINGERLPRELILAAIRFKGAVRLRIGGYEVPGSVGHIDALKTLAAEGGAPGIVEYLGVTPLREDLLRDAVTADIGLSLMPIGSKDINLQHMAGASNKAFDCMACGLPLLVSDIPEWVSTFVEPGFGRACDPANIDSIELQLRCYLENPEMRRKMARRCVDKIEQSWNYEAMFAGALAIIERD